MADLVSVYIVTGYDPRSLQTENVAGFTDLVDAKKAALEHHEMLDQTVGIGHSIRMFIEEWRGGDFRSQRDLRPKYDGDALVSVQWFVSDSPLFLPTVEK